MTSSFLNSIALSFLITLVSTPLVIRYFISRGWVEYPHKKHQKTSNATAISPVPRGGGIAIFVGIFATILLLIPLDKHLKGILIASLLTLVIGVWDDIKDISPKLRLITNLIAAIIIVGSGIGIAYISNPFGGTLDLTFLSFSFTLFGNHSVLIIPDILAIIWIVWCMNIVGWSAGVDGQLPGFVSISALFVGILGLRYSSDIAQWPVIILAGAMAGSYLGFLPFNFFPQKIMPGYSGKSLAGLLLGVLAILSGAKLATMVLLLGVPMVDAVYVLLKRLKNRRFPLSGGPDHLHHQLLKIGFSRRQISILYFVFSLLLGLISLSLNSQQKLYAFLGLLLAFISLVLILSRRT